MKQTDFDYLFRSKREDAMAVAASHLIEFISFFIDALVFRCIWHWFLLSLSMPKIDYFQALGIVILLRFVVYSREMEEKKIYEDPYQLCGASIARYFVKTLYFWLVALISHVLMSFS